MNFTFNEEIDIPLISLTSANDVSDSVKRSAIIGEFFFTFKTACCFLYNLGGPNAMKIYWLYPLMIHVLLKSLVICQVI